MSLNPINIPRRRSSNTLLVEHLMTAAPSFSSFQASILCPTHNQPSLHICTFKGCEDRILCPECYISHPEIHKQSISTSKEILGPDIFMEIEEEINLNNVANSKNEVFMAFNNQVQVALTEVRKRIEKTLETIGKKIKDKVMSGVNEPLFSVKDWERYRAFLHDRRNRFNLANKDEQGKHLQEYLDIYSEVTMALADAGNARELTKRPDIISSDPLSLDQEIVDEAISSLRSMINTLYAKICHQINPLNTPQENIEVTKNINKPYKSSVATFHLSPFYTTQPLVTKTLNNSFRANSTTSLAYPAYPNFKDNKSNNDKTVSSSKVLTDANNTNQNIKIGELEDFVSRVTTGFIYDEALDTDIRDLPYFGPFRLDDGSVYKGQMKDGLQYGKGKQVWKDGRIFEGYFKDGRIEGKGRMRHPDGDVYEGQWNNNVAQGRGKYRRSDGWIYEGEWTNDQPHGNGMEVWPDGTKYEGTYKNGLKHGRGLLKCGDGAWYRGDFKDNMFEGEGTYVWADGRKYEGQWVKNLRDGRGVMTWQDGRRYGGEFVHDRRQGYGTYDWGDGKKYVGYWRDNKPHGQGKLQNPNGEIMEGDWKEGKLGQFGQYGAVSIKDLKSMRGDMNKSAELSDYSRYSVDKMTLRGIESPNHVDSPGAANNASIRSVVVDGLGDKGKKKNNRPDLKIRIKGSESHKDYKAALEKKKEEQQVVQQQSTPQKDLIPVGIKEQRRLSGYKIQIHEKLSS